MKLIALRCPHCGASAKVDSGTTVVTCSYCGVSSRIQERTRTFQVPRPLPAATPAQAAYPVARQTFSWLRMIPFVTALGAIAVGIVFATKAGGFGGRGKMFWGAGAPALVDVDRDGQPDPIGLSRYVMDGDRVHLAAFSGRTGAPLWETEALGDYSSQTQSRLAVVGDQLWSISDRGLVTAREVTTGVSRWTATLAEKVSEICADGPGAAMLKTADSRWWRIDTAGKVAPSTQQIVVRDDETTKRLVAGEVGEVTLCVPIAPRWYRPVGLVSTDVRGDLSIEDSPMGFELLIQSPGGALVVRGGKQPGTSVPMLGRVSERRLAWSTVIPATDPLAASGDVHLTTLTEEAVFVVYVDGASHPHVAAFALADGARRWDVVVSTASHVRISAITTADSTVYVATWTGLFALDAATGARRFLVGTDQ